MAAKCTKYGKYTKILNNVLEQVTPDEKKILAEVDKTLKKINGGLKKQKIEALAIAGGSIAKGTFLRNDYDCDIFVKFDYFYNFQDISGILGEFLKKTFAEKGRKKSSIKIEKIHGSRDYFRITNGISYEIIPVLDIYTAKDAVNTTDCSPLHVEWVNSTTKKNKKLKDEIRLTKAFCKAAGVYGAESYIQGFSGHVVDILTIYYGSFLKLLAGAQKWGYGDLVDITGIYKNKHSALMDLNRSKTQSALIVIDPTLKERNAAAALGEEKFDIFIKKAKEFLRKPSEEFFVKKEMEIEELEKKADEKGGKLVVAEITPKKGKEDVVGAKLLKAFQFIKKALEENDFEIIESGWIWGKKKKALFWFIMDKEKLSEYYSWAGPSLKMKEHVKSFRKKYKDCFTRLGRIYAKIKRKHREPAKFIESLKNDSYIREKIKRMQISKYAGKHKD